MNSVQQENTNLPVVSDEPEIGFRVPLKVPIGDVEVPEKMFAEERQILRRYPRVLKTLPRYLIHTTTVLTDEHAPALRHRGIQPVGSRTYSGYEICRDA